MSRKKPATKKPAANPAEIGGDDAKPRPPVIVNVPRTSVKDLAVFTLDRVDEAAALRIARAVAAEAVTIPADAMPAAYRIMAITIDTGEPVTE